MIPSPTARVTAQTAPHITAEMRRQIGKMSRVRLPGVRRPLRNAGRNSTTNGILSGPWKPMLRRPPDLV